MTEGLFGSRILNSDLGQNQTLFSDVSDIPADQEVVAVTGRTKRLRLLPSLPAISRLWIASLKQAQVNVLGQLSNLRSLCIRSTRASDLSALSALRGLEILVIEDASQLSDLSFVEGLRGLKTLYLSDLRRLTDIGPLAGLVEIRELTLSSGIWNPLELRSLEPFRKLRNLRYLSLSPQMKGGSLQPLSELSNLEELCLNNMFPMEEYAKLKGRLPRVRCANFEELLIPFPHEQCRRCGKKRLGIPIGKGARMLCTHCDLGKIEALTTRFEELALETAVSGSW